MKTTPWILGLFVTAFALVSQSALAKDIKLSGTKDSARDRAVTKDRDRDHAIKDRDRAIARDRDAAAQKAIKLKDKSKDLNAHH